MTDAHQPDPDRAGGPAGRDLQPRGAEPCAGEFRDAGIHRQRRRASARCGCWRRCAFWVWRRRTRFYQASTSELYGLVQEVPQSETTPFYPRSPYAVAKLYAYWITVNYREAYGMHASNGILFNHESPVRGETFVTRKITRGGGGDPSGAAGLPLSRQSRCASATGAMRGTMSRACGGSCSRMRPDDYRAGDRRDPQRAQLRREGLCRDPGARSSGREAAWKRQGAARTAARIRVRVDPRYFRPTEVDLLIGDAAKAHERLGWRHRTSFDELVREMVAADLTAVQREHNRIGRHE